MGIESSSLMAARREAIDGLVFPIFAVTSVEFFLFFSLRERGSEVGKVHIFFNSFSSSVQKAEGKMRSALPILPSSAFSLGKRLCYARVSSKR